MSDAAEYVINSFIWSTVGFIGGYFVCYVGHEIHEIKEVVVDHREVEPTEVETDHRSGRDRRQNIDHGKRRNLLLGVALILLAVGSVITSAFNNVQQNKAVDCQTQYNKAFSVILAQRADAAAQDRQVTQDLLGTVATLSLKDPPLPREVAQRQFRRALENYRDTIAKNDVLRKEHPIPAPPKEACG